MYRIIPATKSSYITNKYIAGSPSTTSNVGLAGTLDLFKLYDETTTSDSTQPIVELSRLLVKFDLERLQGINPDDPTLECQMVLKDVYGGQGTPSNYTLVAYPLLKEWSQGVGMDVVSYRDLDAVNFITASIDNGMVTLWNAPGASALGLDFDGTMGALQNFERGDEDLSMDVTHIISGTLAQDIPNHGFRISFSDAIEQDEKTYFVKRFGSKNVIDSNLKPQLVVKYDDVIQDDTANAWFDKPLNFFTYNIMNGSYQSFFDGAQELLGPDCLSVELIASKSVKFMTSSYSPTHKTNINHVTSSVVYFSSSFLGSQFEMSGIPQKGIYHAPIQLDTTQPLLDFLSGSTSMEFEVRWNNLSGDKTYSRTWTTFDIPQAQFQNYEGKNWIVNTTNLRRKYRVDDGRVRVRVFIYDYSKEQYKSSKKIPSKMKSVIVKDMKWRLIGAYSKRTVIPFDSATRLSYDDTGMYFDFYPGDLEVGSVYEFEFQINNDTGDAHHYSSEGFRFKVVA